MHGGMVACGMCANCKIGRLKKRIYLAMREAAKCKENLRLAEEVRLAECKAAEVCI